MFKRIIVLITLSSCMFLLSITHVSAQTATPVITKRQVNQQKRIGQGVVSGELTKRETRQLKRQQRDIRITKRQAKADGTVTKAERQKISRKQNRANRNVARKKNNKRDRN
ncbi:MAG: hypothetical protein AAF824_14040 [Bacteroidota bacterium]